jgi:hypothetical protein
VIVDTRRFEIQPLHADALDDAAAYLARRRPRVDATSWAPHLRWLLVDNPLAASAPDHGLCLRDSAGAIAGLDLAFPAAFCSGERRMLALGSGGYFVEPEARGLGFYLFKRHLQSPGFAFFFATSCNAASGALWQALGACAAAECDVEYVVPIDLGVVLAASLQTRDASAPTVMAGRFAGRCATALRSICSRTTELTAEPCRDWDKLAELARRHRPQRWITAERSAAYLRWRYGPRSPNHAAELCVFRDRRGNEGWFALQPTARGERTRVRGRLLLDAVWPRDRMSVGDVITTMARFPRREADAIYLRPRPGVEYDACGPWIIRRRREAPPVFAVAARGHAPLTPSSLDLVLADGDGGFPDAP